MAPLRHLNKCYGCPPPHSHHTVPPTPAFGTASGSLEGHLCGTSTWPALGRRGQGHRKAPLTGTGAGVGTTAQCGFLGEDTLGRQGGKAWRSPRQREQPLQRRLQGAVGL